MSSRRMIQVQDLITLKALLWPLLFVTVTLLTHSVDSFKIPTARTSVNGFIRTIVEFPTCHRQSRLYLSENEEAAPDTFLRDVGLLAEKALYTLEDVAIHFRRGIITTMNPKTVPADDPTTKLLGCSEDVDNRRRIVVIGSGWSSHAFLKISECENTQVICISPRPYFVFTPMLAATAVGTVEYRSIVEPIRSANPLTDYLEGEVVDIDPIEKTVRVTTPLRPDQIFTVKYDHLICAPGAKVNDFGFENVNKYCHFIKEIDGVREIKTKILNNFEKAALPGTTVETIKQLLSFVIVGGGPTGVEFSGELVDFLTEELAQLYPLQIPFISISLINAGANILTAFDEALQEQAVSAIRSRGIDLQLQSKVTQIEEEYLIYRRNNEEIKLPYGLCVWAAGTAARSITKTIAERISPNQVESVKKTGKLQVDPWLRVQGLPEDLKGSILAMGDCSLVVGGEEGCILPQTAQVAAQQGAFMARLFNKGFDLSTDTAPRLPADIWYSSILPEASPFRFLNLGLLAYIGGSRALAQVNLGDSQLLQASGEKAYLLWKSVYLVKQVSTRTRVLVLFDYLKAKIFGRDLTSL